MRRWLQTPTITYIVLAAYGLAVVAAAVFRLRWLWWTVGWVAALVVLLLIACIIVGLSLRLRERSLARSSRRRADRTVARWFGEPRHR